MTIFQLHGNLDTLDRLVNELAKFWQEQDAILLLGETVLYTDWLKKQLSHHKLTMTSPFYALQYDFDGLTETSKRLITQTDNMAHSIQLISDDDWVALTQNYDTVMTIAI